MRFYRESRLNSSCPGPYEYEEETIVEDINLFESVSRNKSYANGSSPRQELKDNNLRILPNPSVSIQSSKSKHPEFKTSRDV